MPNSTRLAIQHDREANPKLFRLVRLPAGVSAPVRISSPYEFPVDGQPESNLMRELRWYLEQFLDYPFPPETGHAERVLGAVRAWGTEAFRSLFDGGDGGQWLRDAETLEIQSDDAGVLSWPWEALFDPVTGHLAHRLGVERRLSRGAAPKPPGNLPDGRVNILMVAARPFQGDYRYRSMARPLAELIETKGLPARVDILRPPTFERLREHLRAQPGYYHVLHFDAHGSYDPATGQARLFFENAEGGADARPASELSALVGEYPAPLVVLNACRSAMLDADPAHAFASLATALVEQGIPSVVAMAYSVTVTGAQVFLEAFYRRLFETGSVADAVLAGRSEMLTNRERRSARGRHPLDDWLLPVLYQQQPVEFDFVSGERPHDRESHLPTAIREYRDLYGFIGRDGPILMLERALAGKAPAILVQGLGGIGKTTLARGFLRWLDQTGGLDGAAWFDFREIRSSEYVLNSIGQALLGEGFRVAANRLELLGKALRKRRMVMVWDNFESAAANLTAEDRAELVGFLAAIQGGRGKVVITSRSGEAWIDRELCFAITVGGLDGEERWEYCDAILAELGARVERDDPALIGLMNQIDGHPLAMRVVLAKLSDMPPGKIAEALRSSLAELSASGDEAQDQLFATLRFVENGLAEDLKPLMDLVAMHERYINADLMREMARLVGWTPERTDRLIGSLVAAGLLRLIGQAVTYEMHPLLTSYLRSGRALPPPRCRQVFAAVMASHAQRVKVLPPNQQRIPFLLSVADFYFALWVAERLSMVKAISLLAECLAHCARNARNLMEASRLFSRLTEFYRARGEQKQEAAAWHHLGMVAHDQRDFGAARDAYLKALAITGKTGGSAATYHQLGSLALNQRDFRAACDWYLRSLAVSEQAEDLESVATTNLQLGSLARAERDFAKAREWYLKAVAIYEKKGDADGVAKAYNNLSIVANEEKDFAQAREWCMKSLAIKMKQGNARGISASFHQLGRVAELERKFADARGWYLKSVSISEQQGNRHSAAMTYGQLGVVAGLEGKMEECGKWLVRSVAGFRGTTDAHEAERIRREFLAFYDKASAADRQTLESIWREGNLGPIRGEADVEPAR